jgi:hypothetical protein
MTTANGRLKKGDGSRAGFKAVIPDPAFRVPR